GGLSISHDERLHHGRIALARDAASGTEQHRSVRCVIVHAAALWRVGGTAGHGTGDPYRLCLGLFPDAGLFAGSVCCGQRWQLLQGICQSASRPPFPACFAAGAGGGGGGLLFSAIEGCNRRAGGDPTHSSISGAGRGRDFAEDLAAGDEAPVSYVALSVTCVTGIGGVSLHIV